MSSSPSPRRVLVLGANGRFGQAAVRAFAAAGWQVLAQARRAPGGSLPSAATHLPLALHDAVAIAERAAGAAVVVYALNPIYTRWRREVLPLARQGMDIAARLGARFMLPGNVYNFGSTMPPLLRPDTPQRPDTVKGRVRCELEAEMRQRAGQGLPCTIVRAGDFFGSGTGSWLDLLIAKSLARGKLVYPGPSDVAHAWAYLPDLAQTFAAVAARARAPAFDVLHFAGHTLSGAQLLASIERAAAELGIAPRGAWRHGGFPWVLLRAGGVFVPMWREIAEMAYLWRVPHALDGAALQAAVGELPGTPIDAAMAASLRALGLAAASMQPPTT